MAVTNSPGPSGAASTANRPVAGKPGSRDVPSSNGSPGGSSSARPARASGAELVEQGRQLGQGGGGLARETRLTRGGHRLPEGGPVPARPSGQLGDRGL